MSKMLERHYDTLTKHFPAGTDIPAIEITGAARWFLEESEKTYWSYSEDFPSVMLPYPYTWMEYLPPKTINQGGQREHIPRELQAMGCMAVAVEVNEGEEQDVIRADMLGKLIFESAAEQGIQTVRPPADADTQRRIQTALEAGHSAKWIVIFKMYAETMNRAFDLYGMATYLDSEGRMIPDLHIFFGQGPYFAGPGANASGPVVGPHVFPFLFALSLMHAKNVTLEDVPTSPALAKKHAKRGRPTLRFKTLRVISMRKAASASAAPGESSSRQAMHLARGHFKDFRDGKGLFGKHKGLYWWDMHVRGDKANGQIVKDYEVPTPA